MTYLLNNPVMFYTKIFINNYHINVRKIYYSNNTNAH